MSSLMKLDSRTEAHRGIGRALTSALGGGSQTASRFLTTSPPYRLTNSLATQRTKTRKLAPSHYFISTHVIAFPAPALIRLA